MFYYVKIYEHEHFPRHFSLDSCIFSSHSNIINYKVWAGIAIFFSTCIYHFCLIENMENIFQLDSTTNYNVFVWHRECNKICDVHVLYFKCHSHSVKIPLFFFFAQLIHFQPRCKSFFSVDVNNNSSIVQCNVFF